MGHPGRTAWRRLVGRPRSRRRMLIDTVSGFGAGFALTLIVSVAVLSAAGVGAVRLSTPHHPPLVDGTGAGVGDPNAGISEEQDRSNPGAVVDPVPTTVPATPTPTPTTPAPTTAAPTTTVPPASGPSKPPKPSKPPRPSSTTARPTPRPTQRPTTTAPRPTTTTLPPGPTSPPPTRSPGPTRSAHP